MTDKPAIIVLTQGLIAVIDAETKFHAINGNVRYAMKLAELANGISLALEKFEPSSGD
jgi:hypothetical protein